MTIHMALALILILAGVAAAEPCAGPRPSAACEPRAPFAERGGDALSGSPAKSAQRSPKIHSSIAGVVTSIERRGPSVEGKGPAVLSTRAVHVNGDGAVQVYVMLTDVRPDYVARLEALGLRVELTLPEFRLVQGWLPAGAADAVAALDFVREIKPPGYPVSKGAGAVTTEGEPLVEAPAARARFGVDGAGITVGVLSNGADHIDAATETGDLPVGVQVLKPGTGSEGTAMLEVVHDVAPGASLAFYRPTTSADMVAGINTLAAVGVRIAVDDLTFLDEPKFQDGMIAQTARSFASGGRVYVTAGGNSAQLHYRSVYRRLTSSDVPTGAHNYGGPTGEDFGNTVLIPKGCRVTVVLQWSNPLGASADDFDLVLARSESGDFLAGSFAFQTGTQDAFEALEYENDTGADVLAFIAVLEFKLASAPDSLILDYAVYPSCGIALEYVTPEDSAIGHEAVEEVLSVAALGAGTPTQVESYSSRGPGSISFPAPESRAVPNIAGIDCVSTRVGQQGFFFMPFCGTSAAAPHVAGVAALLMQWAPSLSSEQYRAILTGSATDLGPLGFDFAYGHGRVNALAALGAAPAPARIALGIAIEPPTVSPNQTLHVNISLANAGGAAAQDFYLALQVPPSLSTQLGCPSGDAVIFVADAFSRLALTCLGTAVPQSFAPLFRNVLVPGGLATTGIPDLWTFVWPAVAPGTYTMTLFATPPDAFADGVFQASDFSAVAADTFEALP